MEITQYYPFLKSLTSEIKTLIDWDELYIPNSYEAILVNELCELLDMNVVLYKKGYHSKLNVPLCSVIVSASLNDAQQRAIKRFEEKLDGFCVIVSYNKPLEVSSDFSIQDRKAQYSRVIENKILL